MSPRKAAQPAPYRVWSWWQGGWWMVDHGPELAAMQTSAARRQNYVTSKGINPNAQFVVTEFDQNPQSVWAVHGV